MNISEGWSNLKLWINLKYPLDLQFRHDICSLICPFMYHVIWVYLLVLTRKGCEELVTPKQNLLNLPFTGVAACKLENTLA